MRATGWYFDGKTSARHHVEVLFDTGGLTMTTDALRLRLIFSQLRISPRIGQTVRSIYLEDGAKIELPDNDVVDTWLHNSQQHDNTLIHRLERHWILVIPSLIGIIVTTWALIVFGAPWMAARITETIPTSFEATMGEQTLKLLDQSYLSPSALDDAEKRRVLTLFEQMTQHVHDDFNYSLAFRKGGAIGPNALALPGGKIIITDEMVELCDDNATLGGIFAHESAHVHYRHGMKALIQGSFVILIVSAVTGDISSVSSLVSSMPVFLLENKYSRDFEREADLFATQFMLNNNIDPIPLAELFETLDHHDTDNDVWELLSTHPLTKDRVEQLKKARQSSSDHQDGPTF